MKGGLTDKELSELIRLAKRVLWSPPEIRRKLQDHRVNITPANFYSNVPLVKDIEHSFEYRAANEEVYGRVFNRQSMSEFIDRIAVHACEFTPPPHGNKEDPKGFFWKNGAFSYSDALASYCVLRHFKPSHVLEIGSGFSTLVAEEAIKKNQKGKLTLIDPYPKSFLRRLDTVDQIMDTFVQDIEVPELVQLVNGADVWFIDSTHTVKIGSDCLYIYLKVMPEVSKDILVHSHDVFLPFGMPKKNALNKHVYWTEQYLLYAYLLDNPKVQVLYGSAFAHRFLPEALDRLMLNKYPGGGGSIWYSLNMA